jgi:ligand-binding SRPBCC domain-containing protein
MRRSGYPRHGRPERSFYRTPVDNSLERRQLVSVPPDEAFAFFSDPENLAAITPDWLRFTIESAPERLERGSYLRYRLRLLGVPIRWLTEITEWSPPRAFADVQLAGPYLRWEHAHRFTAVPGGTEVYDHVRYRVPGGPAAPLVHAVVRRWLERIFDYRAERLAELLGSSVENDAPDA